MKLKRLVVLILALCCLLAACAALSEDIVLDEECSCFDNFFVLEGKVYFHCTLVLQNNTDQDITVKIRGDFQEDFSSGLLTEAKLMALSGEYEDSFVLTPGENELKVVFIGEHGGYSIKQNRLLPEIEILRETEP